MRDISSTADLDGVLANVSRETQEALRTYVTHVIRWNATMNLIGKATERDLWERHVLDCAQLVAIMPHARRWLDVGSGAGFPGIVIAILLRGVPGAHVQLVESNRKKAGFLQAMVGALDLPATVEPVRIETLTYAVTDVVTARALAPLTDLLRWFAPWMAHGATALLQKGRGYSVEVAESHDDWQYDLIEHASAVDSQSRILEISNLAARR